VVAAARGRHHKRRQASRDVSAADQRYPAIGGGSRFWPLVRERASNPRKHSLQIDALAIETGHPLSASGCPVYP